MNAVERKQVILDWLGVDASQLCQRCGGRGRRSYGSTATWRGGVGGQMVTEDVCNLCWGTGRSDKRGLDLRRVVLATERDALAARVAELEAEIEQLTKIMECHDAQLMEHRCRRCEEAQ